MSNGQVKAGDGAANTYTCMLQEMVRITPGVSNGIAATYPSVQQLVRGFKEEGPLAVAECRMSANRNGAFTDRMVGQAISKRLYNVFMNGDEWNDNV